MHTIADFLPPTATRVERLTCSETNARIRQETEDRIAIAVFAGKDAIEERLRELDQEWDIERMLECNAATITLASLGLGLLVDKRWLGVPLVVSSFLLLHALEGWCPPIPILRWRGFRTAHEINLERTALRILRGDFHATANPKEALDLSEETTVDQPRIVTNT